MNKNTSEFELVNQQSLKIDFQTPGFENLNTLVTYFQFPIISNARFGMQRFGITSFELVIAVGPNPFKIFYNEFGKKIDFNIAYFDPTGLVVEKWNIKGNISQITRNAENISKEDTCKMFVEISTNSVTLLV